MGGIIEQIRRWGNKRKNPTNVNGDPWLSQPCVLWMINNDQGKYVRKVSVNELPSLGIGSVSEIGGSDYAILIDNLLHTADGYAFNLENAKIYTFTCDRSQQTNNIKYTDTGNVSTSIMNKVKSNTNKQNQYISSTPQAKQMQQTLTTLSQNGIPSPGPIDGVVGKQTLLSFNALFDFVKANYKSTTQSNQNPKVDNLEKIQTIQPKSVQSQSLDEVEWIKQYPCVSTDQFELLQQNDIAIQVRNTFSKKIYNLYPTGRFEEYVNNKLQRTGSFHCVDGGFHLNVVKK